MVYMINSPSSIGTPPLVPGSSDYSDLSSTLWAAFVGNDSGLSCESWVSSGQWIQDAQGYGGNALANAIAAFAGGQGGPAPGQYYYVQFQQAANASTSLARPWAMATRITQWECVNQPNVKVKFVPAPS